MKTITLLVFVFLCFCVNASGQSKSWTYKGQRICQVGNVGYYLNGDEECIDTPQKCAARHGLWGGYKSGLGRSPGCTLPTHDGGKSCKESSECEAACVAQSSISLGPAQPCACSSWSRERKGGPVGYCSSEGIQWIHAD